MFVCFMPVSMDQKFCFRKVFSCSGKSEALNLGPRKLFEVVPSKTLEMSFCKISVFHFMIDFHAKEKLVSVNITSSNF